MANSRSSASGAWEGIAVARAACLGDARRRYPAVPRSIINCGGLDLSAPYGAPTWFPSGDFSLHDLDEVSDGIGRVFGAARSFQPAG